MPGARRRWRAAAESRRSRLRNRRARCRIAGALSLGAEIGSDRHCQAPSEIDACASAQDCAWHQGSMILVRRSLCSAAQHARRMIDRRLRQLARLPAIYQLARLHGGGGRSRMAYGTRPPNMFRQVGIYVDKILRARSPPTCRSSSRPIRAGHQPQDRQGARARDARQLLAARRRGDRMSAPAAKLVRSSRWKSGPSKE